MTALTELHTEVSTEMSTEMPTKVHTFCIKWPIGYPQRLPQECSRYFSRRSSRKCGVFGISKKFLQSEVLGEVCILEGGSSERSSWQIFRTGFVGTFRAQELQPKTPTPLHSKAGENSGRDFLTRFCTGTPANFCQDRARVHNYNFLFSTPPCVFSDVKPDQQRDCSRKAYRGPHLDTGGRCQRGGLELLWQGGVKKTKNTDGTETAEPGRQQILQTVRKP